MSDYNEDLGYVENEVNDSLSKEDLAGAGLLALAICAGVGLCKGAEAAVTGIGEKLDEKGKNPITALKKRRMEKKLQKEIDKAAMKELREKKMAEVKAKVEEMESDK